MTITSHPESRRLKKADQVSGKGDPFIDMVDENVAREHGMQHNNPENKPAVTKAVTQTSLPPPHSTSPQVLEHTQTTALLKQPSPSRRPFLQQQLPPSGCSPARGAELNRKSSMTNAEDAGETSRTALTPRTDKLSNIGVKSPPPSNGMMKEAAMPPRALLTPPRSDSIAQRNRSTPQQQQPVEHTLSVERNRIPKNPRDGASPKQRRPPPGLSSSGSMKSQKSARSIPSPQPAEVYDPDSQEQALFEQRLCEDAYGVAVRKINSNGKAQLRYVKCVPWDSADDEGSKGSASKSATSLKGRFSRNSRKRGLLLNASAPTRALAWGRHNKIPLEKFVSVRKGKMTDRTRKNPQPSSRLLSLVTDTQTLDIEAPTRLDRDKFARAFARFLQIPIESDDAGGAATSRNSPSPKNNTQTSFSTVPTIEGDMGGSAKARPRSFENVDGEKEVINPPISSLGMLAAQNAALFEAAAADDDDYLAQSQNNSSSAPSKVFAPKEFIQGGEVVSGFNPEAFKKDKEEGGSAVSSLTGGNYDQDIVEELHQALESLKVELEESRAEAARAVKVAEQAIQSAENNSSRDWNSTVTHKAAEAAALAQKRSAEAMAKQRLAEERLAGERKNASFWRTQAEVAEEEAGVLQTRAAAAEVQRAAMVEELESERQKTIQMISALRSRFSSTEVHSRDALDSEMSRNRVLEIELNSARRNLDSKAEETKQLQEELHHANSSSSDEQKGSRRKKFNVLGKKKKGTGSPESAKLLDNDSTPSEALQISESTVTSSSMDSLPAGDVLKLHAEFTAIRLQFELLKRTTSDELSSLPETSQFLANQAGEALVASKAETKSLRQRLALESSTRRKLLQEVQDLRGNVRVYCRPRPFSQPGTANLTGSLSMPSNEILLLHRERLSSVTETTPLTFEFDRIFAPDTSQKEMYDELDELVLNALDGYNVCLMTYGASLSGKTHFVLGDVTYADDETRSVEIDNFGVHLQGAHQLFNVSQHRNQRYQDNFSLSIVEVNDERLCDLVAGTDVGEARGSVTVDVPVRRERSNSKASKRSIAEDEGVSQMSTKSRKLEIRVNNDGDTVVEGLVAVDVSSMDDVVEVWKQALSQRALRLRDQGVDLKTHESGSHLIATLKITSKNIATGVGTQGRIQFVEFAAADLRGAHRGVSSKSKNNRAVNDDVLSGVGNSNDWKYINKSLATVNDVVSKRAQFVREVPYRNSTITHLLQDALEGDTKVLMMLCVSADPKDMQETASALRFAAKMKQVNVGKATKHALQR